MSLQFTTTYLPQDDGPQQSVTVVVNIPTQSGAYLRAAHDTYAEARGTNTEEYLLYTIIGPSYFPLNLDTTVAKAGFSITNPWATARPFSGIDVGPNLPLPDSKDDSNNIDRGQPVILNVFTTTHNATQTPISTIVAIP